MNFYIRKTQAAATCGGTASDCTTYKAHPDWEKLKKSRRHIPKGEFAFYIDYGLNGQSYCLCHKHAPLAIIELRNQMTVVSEEAERLGWMKR